MSRRDHKHNPAGGPSRRMARALGLALGVILSLAQASWAAPGASEQVARLNAALLAAMQGGTQAGFERRYALIDTVAREVFDFPGMARSAAGSFWASIASGDQAKLVEAFARLSVATYAARFDGFSGERFEVKGESPAGRGAVMVSTHLVKSDGAPVAINYLLREEGGGWKVADVMLEAKYSELAIKRSEFTAVLKTDGIAGLLARIEDRIKVVRTGGGG